MVQLVPILPGHLAFDPRKGEGREAGVGRGKTADSQLAGKTTRGEVEVDRQRGQEMLMGSLAASPDPGVGAEASCRGGVGM
jgi:hypothetical protein